MHNTCECPYCGYENDISDFEGDSFDQECSNCEEEFEVTVEYEPTFTANKIEYIKCDECCREERSSCMSYENSTYPYPKKYKGKEIKLCHDCYVKGVFEDMEELENSDSNNLIKELWKLGEAKEEIMRGEIDWGN